MAGFSYSSEFLIIYCSLWHHEVGETRESASASIITGAIMLDHEQIRSQTIIVGMGDYGYVAIMVDMLFSVVLLRPCSRCGG